MTAADKTNLEYSVSVGIPAYNEQANIKHLLLALLAQVQTDFVLKEILVVSDGSTDNTVALAESIPDARVQVIAHADRQGQAIRQNEILQKFSGDILVLLNADILPKNENFLEKFIAPFRSSETVGLVGCRGETLPATTFVEKILNYSVKMKEHMFMRVRNGINIYTCHGHSRALSKAFAKQLTWPSVMAEDSYSYLICKERRLEYAYTAEAAIYFREPQTLRDHIKQSVRFAHSKEELKKLFPPETVDTEFRIPSNVFWTSLIKYFFYNPLLFTGYICIQLFTKLNPYNQKSTSLWDPSTTSKALKS